MKPVLVTLLILAALASVNLQAAPGLTLTHAGVSDVLDRDQLEAMSQITIKTETPYLDGEVTFTGPSLSTLLDRLGAKDTDTVTLHALNNYQVSETAGELRKLDAIVATRMEGKPMSVRSRGPFWVMLPLSSRPELDHEDYHRLMIWQLSAIVVD